MYRDRGRFPISSAKKNLSKEYEKLWKDWKEEDELYIKNESNLPCFYINTDEEGGKKFGLGFPTFFA